MRVVIQRVSQANVIADGVESGKIEKGFLLLVGVEEEDASEDVDYLTRKIANLRVFEDEEGVSMTSELRYLGEDFYTIPQLFVGTLEVDFEVKYADATWIPQTEVLEKVEICWDPNTHYTYTLTLTENKMKIHPGISNWNNRE